MRPLDQMERFNRAMVGRYKASRALGAGGMAMVYLAEDLKHSRQVAVKVLRPEVAAAMGRERFLREIHVVAALHHPHILPLHDSGDADGLLYYVMPFASGESLRARLVRERQLGIDDAIAVTRQIASALDYAHGNHLIHRDIKPENILLQGGQALLADFGIAMVDTPDDRITATGMAMGTPQYMSPEQAAGERTLDARSDLYSLACVTYEMLAGEPPFSGPTARAILASRFTDRAPHVRGLRPGTPEPLERALSRALERMPLDRFPSAGAFAAALTTPVPERDQAASVAVLPFRSLGVDPDNAWFADGIAEDVIAQLSKIRALRVTSRASSIRFRDRQQSNREIGNALQVRALLEGSVRRAGDRVRIVAQLVDVDSDRQLWADTYDRELTDVFAIQADVALKISSALEAELTADERARVGRAPTSNLKAYQLHVKARHFYGRFTEKDMLRGITYFKQAIAEDPGYALAYAGIALTYAEFATGATGGPLTPDDALAEAQRAVVRALELDGRLAEAHAVNGLLRMVGTYDWAGAEEEFRLALELNPNSADTLDHYGWLCAAMSRFDEAIALVRRAQELDPLTHRADLANTYLRAGRLPEAKAEILRALEFEPRFPRSRAVYGWVRFKQGEMAGGIAEMELAMQVAPDNMVFVGQLGEMYGLAGRRDDAKAVLARMESLRQERYVSPYFFAYVHTGLGDHDQAMDCLERAYQERGGSVFGVKASFAFEPLRSLPRFRALLRKMNLE